MANIIIPKNQKKSNLRAISLSLFVVVTIWIWLRYPIIKANWPQITAQWNRVKAIWHNEINVLNQEIKPEFHGLHLFMKREEIYQVIGKENTREVTTEIPEVNGILIEDRMIADDYGFEYWKDGQGRMWKRGFTGDIAFSSEMGDSIKDNPWIKTVNEQQGTKEGGVQTIRCYYFGDIFYKLQIAYNNYYAAQTPWENFIEPTLKAYNLKAQPYSQGILLNDGKTSLVLQKARDEDYREYYVVVYQNNKIAADTAVAHERHFPVKQF